uniref:Sodium/potassium-transporting ATPase subunit beta n=1 Tax=Panagrellus redivivus TaxID=6233 RepID=A0A7E4W1D0_PANRE
MSAKKGGSRYQPEETSLVANGKPAAAPVQKTGFKHFLYNKEEGSCLGRTAKSWFQILLFYIIFYTLLACFWLGCLYLFLSTLDYQLPRYHGPGTIIGVNPGLGYQPWVKSDPESTLIRFNTKDPESYKNYVEALDKYLEKYGNTTNTRTCGPGQSNKDVIVDGKLDNSTVGEACRFNLDTFAKAGCSKANAYGFKDGKPCIILSLNRLIGWTPEDYDGDVPAEVAGRYKKGSVAFNCEGTYDPDREYIGERQYVPPEGIDGRFFPYAVMPNYHQPIALVKFNSLPVNRLVQIQCRGYAKNVIYDIENGLGLVNFELIREDYPPKPRTEE